MGYGAKMGTPSYTGGRLLNGLSIGPDILKATYDFWREESLRPVLDDVANSDEAELLSEDERMYPLSSVIAEKMPEIVSMSKAMRAKIGNFFSHTLRWWVAHGNPSGQRHTTGNEGRRMLPCQIANDVFFDVNIGGHEHGESIQLNPLDFAQANAGVACLFPADQVQSDSHEPRYCVYKFFNMLVCPGVEADISITSMFMCAALEK